MMLRPSVLTRLAIAAAFLLAGFSSPAYAKRTDDKDKLPPYDVSGITNTRVWVPWVFAFVFAAGAIVVAFKNPHRVSGERT